MRAGRAALALALAAATTGPAGAAPQPQTPEALATVLARHGCMVAPGDTAAIFVSEGFTPGFVSAELTRLLVDGIATEDHLGRLSLPVSLCPPDAPAPTPRDLLLARAAASDCTIRRADLPGIEADLGLSEAQLRAILTPIVAAGGAEAGIASVRLAPDLCAAVGSPASGGRP